MKSYSSLFPSYYFRDDDAPVFFESNDVSDLLTTISDEILLEQPNQIIFEPITGSIALVNLLKRAKTISSSFGRKVFEELRGKTNYYEGLGKGCYLNRSAMKLVNLDYVFSLIEPSSASYATSSNCGNFNGESQILAYHTHRPPRNDLSAERPHFSFVDLCGGPGGFIECITLKCRHLGIAVTGFGMTLLIGDDEPGCRGIMKACNWNIGHLQDPPYSVILTDQKVCNGKTEGGLAADDDSIPVKRHVTNNETDNSIKIIEKEINQTKENITENKANKITGKDEDSECKIFLVGGETGTGDICVKENLDSLCGMLRSELPICESGCNIKGRMVGVHENEMEGQSDSMDALKKKSIDGNDNEEEEEEKKKEEREEQKYVSFVCSDGFDHETEAFRIVLCQVIGMVKTLKVGGNFIMKVFSCTKIHTLKLFVLLSELFQRITLTKPVTSRPVSGERFLVATTLRAITVKSRAIIEKKLWGVCDEIIEWEERMKEKTKVKNLEAMVCGVTGYENQATPHDETLEKETKNEEKMTEISEKTEINEDDNFRIFWPFSITQESCNRATRYLCAINNSHITTQLIANFKLLKLAEERGLHFSDKKLIEEIGNIEIPNIKINCNARNNETEINEKSTGVSTDCERTENSSDEESSEDDFQNTKKKNKRRATNNKKRRQNKKKKIIESEILRLEGREDKDIEEEREGRKVTFQCVREHVQNGEKEACNNENNNDNNYNNENGNNDVQDKNIGANNKNEINNINIDKNNNNTGETLKTTNTSTSLHSESSNFRKNKETISRNISDLVNAEEKQKSIRVHEYYRNWRIYDLDVVYY